jgi:hypothetical protein
MNIQESPAEIQVHWNLIGRRMTAPPPVLSPSSILPPPESHGAFIPANKYLAAFQTVILLLR